MQCGDQILIKAHGVVQVSRRKFTFCSRFIGHCPAEVRLHKRRRAPNGLTEIGYRKLVVALCLVSEAPFEIKASNPRIEANCCTQIGDGAIIFADCPEPDASVGECADVRRI